MGWLSRVKKIATGIGGAAWAPVGLVKDLASAPFVDDDEYDGFINTIYQHTVRRGGRFLEASLGPNEGLGALVGGIPEPVRDPVGDVLGGVGAGLEFAYREGVAEPVTTALTVGSLADAPGGGGIGGLFSGENWREGYRVAQDRSPGQAFALAIGTKNINDRKEVAKYAATDAYEVISGTTDAALRLGVAPEIIAGKAVSAGRVGFARPIETLEDINKADRSLRLHRFNAELEGKTAAEIRDQFFPNHSHGAPISALLADAGDMPTRRRVLRGLMGDRAELDLIRADRADLAGQLERATAKRNTLIQYADDGDQQSLFNDPAQVQKSKAEVDLLYSEQERLDRAQKVYEEAPLRNVPRVSRIRAGTTRVTRSDFYQKSPYGKPLRKTFGMLPHNFVNLHDTRGDVHIHRMLRQSNLDLAEQDRLRSAYIQSALPEQRQQVLLEAEEASVRSIAEGAGMTTDELESVLNAARQGRARAAAVIKSRTYDAEGRSRLHFEDEAGTFHEVDLPLWVTQEANVLPLADMREVKRAATRMGQFRARHPNTPQPTEYLDSFYKVWRPSVLLRGAWPIRVVGDEQLRIFAKIGALTQVKNIGSALRRDTADRIRQLPETYSMLQEIPRRGTAAVRADLRELADKRGKRFLNIDGYQMEDAFGAPGDADNVFRELTSARSSWNKAIGQHEDAQLRQLRESTGEWRTIRPDEPDYRSAWEWAVNKQLGQDEMARKFLAGSTADEVAQWLRSTPEGQVYARHNRVRARNPERWAEMAEQQVEAYTLGNPELKQLALRKKATAADLVRVAPDAAERPFVHGEILQQSLGKGPIARNLNSLSQTMFKWLGEKPTNVLSRNRFFEHMYRAEAERLVKLLDDQSGRLDLTELQSIQRSSREYALHQTRELLYDLAEESDLAASLRHFVPFYSAWQEVITRWSGLAAENPAFVLRMRQVWQAPEKAGLITDENGREIEWGKDYAEGERGAERYLTLALPEWAQKTIPGLRHAGKVKFNKKSFNMVLQGWPGFGPPVQIPVNEIVKARPDLEASFKFVLPFGTTSEFRDMLLPAFARRAYTLQAGEEDRQYHNSMIRIFNDMVVDYELGKRETKPTWDEAKKATDDFWKMRTAASWFSPAAPSFESPYQMYIDSHRQAQQRYAEDNLALADEEGNERTPDEWFLDEFGAEYFSLTQSLSKSMDGIPPTLEGQAARKKYRDLIERHPDLGRLIIGAEGAGEFNGAVYDAQIKNALYPGSADKQREIQPFEEAQRGPDVRMGWIKYTRAMDSIEAERIARGLPNLQVKAARDLSILKRSVIDGIAQEHPEWFEDFSVVDRNKWNNRLVGLQEIAGDRRLQGRDDIAGLREYLDARQVILEELGTRKAKTLTASANQDLARLWDAITGSLVERNLAFADLYYRWLERDPMASESVPDLTSTKSGPDPLGLGDLSVSFDSGSNVLAKAFV